MAKQRTRTMTNEEYQYLKRNIGRTEITDTLVERLWDFKWYGLCNNAKNVRTENKSGVHPKYINIKYYLGDLKDVSKNIRLYDMKLHQRGLEITRIYLENKMNNDYSPTLHRLNNNSHYEYGKLDILPKREHIELDKGNVTIVKEFVRHSISKEPKEIQPLTTELLKTLINIKKFSTTEKSICYLKGKYDMTYKQIKRLLDNGEFNNTEKGKFELLREESENKIFKIKLEETNRKIKLKLPDLDEVVEQMKALLDKGEWSNDMIFKRLCGYKFRHRLKKDGYETLKVRWSY